VEQLAGPKSVSRLLAANASTNILDIQAVAIPHYAVIANVIQQAAFSKLNDPSIPKDNQRYWPGGISTGILPLFRECTSLHETNYCLSWLQISMAWLSMQVLLMSICWFLLTSALVAFCYICWRAFLRSFVSFYEYDIVGCISDDSGRSA
jgi:hypothetical protein